MPRTIRVAAWLFIANGVFWGLFALPYAAYIQQQGRLPMTPAGFESMAGPLTHAFGYRAAVWLLVPMGLLGWVEVVAGHKLRRGQRSGGRLALVLFAASLPFWIGFALPIWLVLGPLRVLLIAAGRSRLR